MGIGILGNDFEKLVLTRFMFRQCERAPEHAFLFDSATGSKSDEHCRRDLECSLNLLEWGQLASFTSSEDFGGACQESNFLTLPECMYFEMRGEVALDQRKVAKTQSRKV